MTDFRSLTRSLREKLRTQSKVRILIETIALAVAVFYTYDYVRSHWGQMTEAVRNRLNPWMLAAAAASVFLAYIFYCWAVRILLYSGAGHRISWKKMLIIIWMPLVYRYVPGKVLYFASRLNGLNVCGVPEKKGAVAFLFENAFYVATALLIGSAALASAFQIPAWLYITGTGGLICIFLFLLKVKPAGTWIYPMESRQVAGLIAAFVFFWIASGISFYFVWISVTSALPPVPVAFIISAFTFSYISGYLAFFIPCGLGIREGALWMFLQTAGSKTDILLMILLSRLIFVAVEALLSGTGTLLSLTHRFSKGKGRDYEVECCVPGAQ